jgi:hypothetical protein
LAVKVIRPLSEVRVSLRRASPFGWEVIGGKRERVIRMVRRRGK